MTSLGSAVGWFPNTRKDFEMTLDANDPNIISEGSFEWLWSLSGGGANNKGQCDIEVIHLRKKLTDGFEEVTFIEKNTSIYHGELLNNEHNEFEVITAYVPLANELIAKDMTPEITKPKKTRKTKPKKKGMEKYF